jgi:hypothetical protein
MIFVIGTGRCGSSAVARNLNDMVWMGCCDDEADELNPEGYYEDTQAKRINRAYIKNEMSHDEFLKAVRHWMESRNNATGFKDPRLCHLFWEYRRLHQFVFQCEPAVIVVLRDRDSTIDSVQRCYEWTRQEAEHFVDVRTGLIDNIIKYHVDVRPIDMTHGRSDEDIKVWLETTMCPYVSLSPEKSLVVR